MDETEQGRLAMQAQFCRQVAARLSLRTEAEAMLREAVQLEAALAALVQAPPR